MRRADLASDIEYSGEEREPLVAMRSVAPKNQRQQLIRL